MALQIGIFILGLVILSVGAEILIRGSSRLAVLLGIRPFVVGVTILAYGTSLPELTVSSFAAIKDATSIALGNVIGSNMFNTSLILGIAALIVPIYLKRETVKLEVPFNSGLTILLAAMCVTGVIGLWNGIVLLVLFSGYIFITIRKELRTRNQRQENGELDIIQPANKKFFLFTLFMIFGLFGLFAGAKLMVDSAIVIAREMGISERIIGITIVAMGTSLPEMAATMAAAFKKETELILGNLIGSNIFNITLIIGVASSITPIRFDPVTLIVDFGALFINAAMIHVFLLSGARVNRIEGGALVLLYAAFLILLKVF